MKANNYEEVIAKLKPYLLDYLNLKGIDAKPKGKIHCLNPKHDDSSPSMGFYGGAARNERAHCFSCGFNLDIFVAAHILENRPLVGSGFVIDNLAYLADLFQIPIDISNIKPEDLVLRDIGLLYQEAANYIQSCPIQGNALAEIERRNWDLDICKSHLVGCVDSYETFIKHLVDKGFSELVINESSIAQRQVFADNRLIFTITDAYGQPVGFISKNLLFEKGVASTGSKYYVAPRSDIKVRHFHPSKHIIGLGELGRQVKLPSEIYIVEGPADWLSMIHAGITNVVALNGSSMSEEQLQNLIDHGYTNYVLMLDGDKAGIDATIRILDNVVAGRPVKCSVAQIIGDFDPDELYKAMGKDLLMNVCEPQPAFEWRLNQFEDGFDARMICDKAIPLIISEPSSIVREEMVQILALNTGFSVDAIREEIHRQENSKLQEVYDLKVRLTDSLSNKVKKSPGDALISAYELVSALETLEESSESSIFTPTSITNDLIAFKVADEDRELHGSGFKLDKLQNLQMALDGDWKMGRVLAFGGAENTGKTALMSQIALEIACNNPDTTVMVHTIDDMAIHYIRRWVTQLTNDFSGNITINKIGHPNYYIDRWPLDNQGLVETRQLAYQRLIDLFKNNSLMIRDATHGDTVSWTASWVRFIRKQDPNRKIVVVCDNFHNFKDFPGTDERIRFKNIIDFMKIYLAQKLGTTVLTTVEYTKLGPNDRPINDSIAETKAIMYRTDFIGHLYSPGGAVTETNPDYFHRLGNGKKAPIVELIIGKNKISGVKDSFFLKFFPEQSHFNDISKREVEEVVAQNRQELYQPSTAWQNGKRVA